jgi:hypothetical protein
MGNPEEALNRQRLLATLLVMLTLGASKGRDRRGGTVNLVERAGLAPTHRGE